MKTITVATWICHVQAAGYQLSQFQARAAGGMSPVPNSSGANTAGGIASPFGNGQPGVALFRPVLFGAANLSPVPWIVENFAIQGNLTVVAAPGGGAKTVALIDLLVCYAAGRTSWMGFQICSRNNGQHHRAGILSGEEDENKIGLLVDAACQSNQLGPPALANVAANLVVHDAGRSGLRIGEPRANNRELYCPEAEDVSLARLKTDIIANDIGLLVLDTVAVLIALPSEIDNTAGTVLFRRLARLAGETGCAIILLHHTPKLNKSQVADLRGDAAAIRGGGFITNTARIAWTLSGLPAEEAASFAMVGQNSDAVRRLDPVKLNDAPKPQPVFLEVIGVPVKLRNGATENVRAVRGIQPPQAGAGRFPTPLLDAAMRAIDTGVIALNGARLPLAAGAGPRCAKTHVATAVLAVSPHITSDQAKNIARELLKELQRVGCAEIVDVQIPKVKKDGTVANGHDPAKGWVTRWHLCPWTAGMAPAASSGPSSAPTAAQPPVAPTSPSAASPGQSSAAAVAQPSVRPSALHVASPVASSAPAAEPSSVAPSTPSEPGTPVSKS